MMEIVFWLTAMTLLKGWFKSSLMRVPGPLPWAKGKRLVADEAVDGGGSHQERASNVACHGLAGGDVLKKRKGTGAKMALHCIKNNVKRGCVAVDQRL